ncbi:MAG TPA: hypothetical protein VLM79_19845, partial [Kofleriaceae bacterium]|nr:hypothetical protein [Kofleriaceae bacterium]
PVGAIDQMTASLGVPGFALFMDMRSHANRLVRLPDADLLVISSGIRHDHAAGDYRVRHAECMAAARALGVSSLRDVELADLSRIAALPEPLSRRARHIVTENARVLAAVEALERNDLAAVGRLFAESHDSQRDDFAVSIAAIDALVELATAHPEVWGARLTGGGFGGSIVALARRSTGPRVAAAIDDDYARTTGHTGRILLAGPVPNETSDPTYPSDPSDPNHPSDPSEPSHPRNTSDASGGAHG